MASSCNGVNAGFVYRYFYGYAKVVKMVLIHDMVDIIDAGDVFIYDTKKSHTNTTGKNAVAYRIFDLSPEKQAYDFIAI